MPRPPAIGSPHGCSQRKTVVLLDNDTHAEIRAIAMEKNRSFAWILRLLIELGLETRKQ